MSKTYKTGTVSRRVGVQPALLRAWETRYGLLTPARGPGGQRVYSESDVALLTAVRWLVDHGHAIGEIATWSHGDILRAFRQEKGTDTTPARGGRVSSSDKALLTVDRDGIIVVASPNCERLLGWPHGMLAGQPLWGLLLDVPRRLEIELQGDQRTSPHGAHATWLRRRDGTATACRLEYQRRRDVADGTTTTIALSPLFDGGGEETLSPLLDKLDLLDEARTLDERFDRYVSLAVEAHGAKLARVWRYNPGSGTLHLVASRGLSNSVDTSARSVIRIANYRYKVGVVARSGIPYVHHGLASDGDFDRAWVTREHLESAAVLPLVVDGELVGVTAQFFRSRLGPEDIGRIQTAAALCESWIRASKSAPPARRSGTRRG
jgi:PAS domain S-box-containing protein